MAILRQSLHYLQDQIQCHVQLGRVSDCYFLRLNIKNDHSRHTASVYLQTTTDVNESPEDLLAPYLHFISPCPLYSEYYSERVELVSLHNPPANFLPVNSPSAYILPEVGDWHAKEAERLFWEVIKELQVNLAASRDEGEMWPPREDLEEQHD